MLCLAEQALYSPPSMVRVDSDQRPEIGALRTLGAAWLVSIREEGWAESGCVAAATRILPDYTCALVCRSG